MTKDVSSCTTATAPIHRDQAAVTIHCKDYAAWTALHVTLLKNNQAIHDQPITVTLPLDTNGDRIADTWQREEVRRWNTQYRLDPDDPDWVNPNDSATWTAVFGTDGSEDAEPADSDGEAGPMPAMADDGDGLKAIEEYRGFFLDGGPGMTTPRHKRLSAARKDLLVECSVERDLTSAAKNGSGTNHTALAAFTASGALSDVSEFYRDTGRGAEIDFYWANDAIVQPGDTVDYNNSAFPNRGAWEWTGLIAYRENPNQQTITVSGAGVPVRDLLWRKLDQGNHDDVYGNGLGTLQVVNRNPRLGRFVKLLLPTRIGYLQGGLTDGEVDPGVARYLDDNASEHSAANSNGARVSLGAVADEGIGYYKPQLNRHFTGDEFNRLARRVMAHEVGHLIYGFDHSHSLSGDTLMDDNPLVLESGVVRGLETSRWHHQEITKINLRAKSSTTP